LAAHLRIEVFGQLSGWHQLQNGLPKNMLSATGESRVSDRRKAVGKDIEEFALSRIFQIPHGAAPSAKAKKLAPLHSSHQVRSSHFANSTTTLVARVCNGPHVN